MHNLLVLHVLDPLHHLLHDYSRLFLRQIAPLLNQSRQVEAISVLLDHVDLVLCLNRRDVLDAVLTSDHTMDFALLENHLHLVLVELCSVEDFAGVDSLACIDS